MKKILKWVVIPLVVLGALIWFGVPALVEMDWARDEVKKALATSTGRAVDVGSISFSWTRGLGVSDVVVQQKTEHPSDRGPLLRLDKLHIDVGLRQLMDRKLALDEILVEEPQIVAIRFPDGTFNFSDLMAQPSAPAPTPTPPDPGGGTGEPKPAPGEEDKKDSPAVTAKLAVRDARVVYIDQKLGTEVVMQDFDTDATYDNGKVILDSTFTLNGGAGVLKANADLSVDPSPFQVSEFSLDGTSLDANLANLGIVFPLMGDKPQQASGKVAFSLKDIAAKGFDMPSLQQSLAGQGTFRLEGGTLLSGPVIQLMSAIKALGAGDLSGLTAGAADQSLALEVVSSTFRIAQGRVHSDNLNLTGKGMEMALAGSTGLDGGIDYDLKIKGLDDLLKSQPQVAQIIGSKGHLPFKLTGSLASPSLSVDAEGAIKGAVEGALKGALEGQAEKLIPGGLKEPEKLIPGGLGGLIPGGEKKKKE
jgi:hypothetical protein